MYRITGQTVELTRGDSLFAQVDILRDGKSYTPQNGDVVRFYLKRDKTNALKTKFIDGKPLITKVIPNDTLVLYLEPNDTKTFEFGQYRYDIEITFANGDVDTFINDQIFRLLREVG